MGAVLSPSQLVGQKFESKSLSEHSNGNLVANSENVPSMSSQLAQSIQDLNQEIQGAEKMGQDFLLRGQGEVHRVMIAMEQADLSFRFMNQVRTKVISAYQEMMRMSV